ncbi:Uncharacterised protein [Mycobacteroides abscessus subsp. abscessus]|jgi:hypothetical protein|nr:Uncharacterised protein [Mycobacteroides abscessus subsp. abscessus]SKL81447.1 Uncharacterised protein [Mycobacteroides abscessus subsp. abscessus]SKM52143.1 Uncharacterised protein [Mycobacteroides abscessus subsp. abscessus]SLK34366.1 Uncharacterised protein [Mycobacteroides abscessus subsp. abscessus]
MSEVQKLMTEVLEQHYLRAETNRIGYCGQECDWSGQFGDHPKHLAAEIDKALGGLTREYCARHHSGGGALGFTTESDASRHIADNPPVPGGVERPPDPGYSGVESRWVSGWTEATE